MSPAAVPAFLVLATDNAAALWTAVAVTRGHPLIRRPGFLCVDGTGLGGVRILVLRPDPDPDELAELTDLVRRQPRGEVLVEDPYCGVDLAHLGLTPRQMPVMIRQPAPVPAPALPVTRVSGADQLALAQLAVLEQIVVHGFPLTHPERYDPGRAFPAGLLGRPEVECYLARLPAGSQGGGEVVGGCLAIAQPEVAGAYWVTTLPAFRSRGVGRALMHAVLGREVPVTLTAAKPGRPLYDSLGFQLIGYANWWA